MKRSGFFQLDVLLMIFFWVLLLSGTAYLGSRIVEDYRAYNLTRQLDVLDNALLMYAKSHRSVGTAQVEVRADREGNDYLFYKSGARYPKNLAELGKVRDEQGYFAEAIDLSKFTYTTAKDSNGNMTYTLGVTMPNGYYYTSPRSGK